MGIEKIDLAKLIHPENGSTAPILTISDKEDIIIKIDINQNCFFRDFDK